eukprot:SM000041S15492  [mRNA]  locus=s41:445838:445984:+ [translate_table: standard]
MCSGSSRTERCKPRSPLLPERAAGKWCWQVLGKQYDGGSAKFDCFWRV